MGEEEEKEGQQQATGKRPKAHERWQNSVI
jgi:hypothetical protein